jgi:predicted transcriptional regulator of viral defense system
MEDFTLESSPKKKTQTDKQRELLRTMMESGDVARWSDMREDGISRRALVGMVDKGEVVKVGHNIYRLVDAPVRAFSNLADIAAKYPDGFIVCLISAARHHGLVTQMPVDTWVALPPGSKPSDGRIRCVQWAKQTADGKPHKFWNTGVDNLVEGVNTYQITSPARTVVDLYRWRNRIPDGSRIFHEALNEYALKEMDRASLRRIGRVFKVDGEISNLLIARSEFVNSF